MAENALAIPLDIEDAPIESADKDLAVGITDFYDNIVNEIPDNDRTRIYQDIKEKIDADILARTRWRELMVRGIRSLGVSEEIVGGANFKGASKAVHPLLAKALLQFSSRAIIELFPPGGPVKTTVVGKRTPEKEEQAARVNTHMNYQYTQEIPGAYEETDRLLFSLPAMGSMFKKMYNDSVWGPSTRTVSPDDFIVPFRATSLRSCERYTERLPMTKTEVLRRQASGEYIKFDVTPMPTTGEEGTEIRDVIDDTERADEPDKTGDYDYILFESHINYDLAEYDERATDKYPVPYIITLDEQDQTIISVKRNWRESDNKYMKRLWYSHWKFYPGFGFYGNGYYHMAGGLSDSATGALRALLDAAQFANLQGGWKTRDGADIKDDTPIAPGEWRETDATYEDLKRAFFPINYKEPSKTLFELLVYLGDQADELNSTTDVLTGEGSNAVPVGTTLARVEQGTKIYSAIHKRLHNAQRQEFKILAEINSETLPGTYPFDTETGSHFVKMEDYDDRVDVLPVSDPETVTATQRIAQAQSAYQLSQEAPDLYDREAVHRNLLRALRMPNLEELMKKDDPPPPMDPIGETMALANGQPVQAYPEQMHEPHIQVLDKWFAFLPPDIQQQTQGAWLALRAQHYAYWFVSSIEEQIGPASQMTQDPATLSFLMAQAANSVEPPVDLGAESEQAVEEAKASADIARKDRIADADIRRKDALLVSDLQRDYANDVANMERERMLGAQDILDEQEQILLDQAGAEKE